MFRANGIRREKKRRKKKEDSESGTGGGFKQAQLQSGPRYIEFDTSKGGEEGEWNRGAEAEHTRQEDKWGREAEEEGGQRGEDREKATSEWPAVAVGRMDGWIDPGSGE
ncbi:hypothetical protein DL93DRAFT_2097215 [Clavulina sp. PMI_390]|nr:hypothetical protein DL93DRAFT_2097215 [Clavulina sp. PMI_390]